MVSPKQPTGSLTSTENKRPSSSSHDVLPFSKHPEVDDAPPSAKRLKGDDNVDTLEKISMLPSENSKELQSTDQLELEAGKLLIVCGHDQYQGKWVALLDRKGSGHVQVNGKTISKYSSCFLNSGDEVVLSQAENNAYIVQLLLESPSDVGTSFGKGKLLNIENQVEDALAIARAFDLSVFSNPCRDLFSLKPTSQLDGLELDSAANIGNNNATDFELFIGLMPASTSEMSSKSAAVMEKHYAAIIDDQNIEVSFDDFPYYLRILAFRKIEHLPSIVVSRAVISNCIASTHLASLTASAQVVGSIRILDFRKIEHLTSIVVSRAVISNCITSTHLASLTASA
ncbi:hypothetical protein CQW23_33714 [Capsicum baccatum]|uniref:FHA domain-containing protein n=1 Tax=Capsicum baccatum TaxID=33114 RepID=A0A2G2V160_CAPBA|nr:hypothetical protein CQW23_33714 [Capsicum baccatum]